MPFATSASSALALQRVPLLAADPSLADDLSPDEAARARATVHVGAVALPPGEWLPPAERPDAALGLLVVEGLALRQVELSGRQQSQVLGPGDVVDPWSAETRDLAPRPAPWRLVEPVTLALLDAPAVVATTAHPGLALALTARLVERAEQLSALATLAQLPRVDLRLLALTWHLAQRWGRMSGDGVLLHLPLTHEALSRLAGARRPSITLALQQLDRCGLLRRRPGGGDWVLHRDAEAVLHGDGGALDAYYATHA